VQECKSLDEVEAFDLKGTFRVSAVSDSLRSVDIEKKVGEIFFKFGNKVDLKTPEKIIFVEMIEGRIFIGVDLTPTLLSKREYRIRIHNQSINACIAYGLVRLSGYDAKKILVDSFAKDGVVAIEALKFKKGKVYAVDELFNNVKSIEVNAKLAGVRKELNVSRVEAEWLDTKFQENEIQCFVSVVPYVTRNTPEKDIKKIYDELFYHLEFIMKKKGRMVFIAPELLLLKEMCKFTLVEERKVATSNLIYDVLIYEK
jgi:23S rRNA G2445 N2-methylase RlmL